MTTLSEMLIAFELSILTAVVDVHLFIKEMGWEGFVGWEVGTVKAKVTWVTLVHPPTFTTTPTSSGPLKLGHLSLLTQLAFLRSQWLGQAHPSQCATCLKGQ